MDEFFLSFETETKSKWISYAWISRFSSFSTILVGYILEKEWQISIKCFGGWTFNSIFNVKWTRTQFTVLIWRGREKPKIYFNQLIWFVKSEILKYAYHYLSNGHHWNQFYSMIHQVIANRYSRQSTTMVLCSISFWIKLKKNWTFKQFGSENESI